ncbi:MAG: urease accessory protein UreE [Chromatiaceae bacterium]|nr:urease accessory protein UreE [Chromatiaceae bacterium]
MIRLTQKLDHAHPANATLTLPYDSRTKSRLRVVLDDGREAGLFLERGGLGLKDGDLLGSEKAEGLVVQVRAAPETLSVADCRDHLLLARACYHLGNRHVPVCIRADRLSYPHDPVLDAMLGGLGLAVRVEHGPFEPEPGAYASGAGHAHGQAHAPAGAVDDAHTHDPGHPHTHFPSP